MSDLRTKAHVQEAGTHIRNTRKLEAAAAIAPVVRALRPEVKRRRIKVYDRNTGAVKGEAPLADAIAGVLAAHQIEIEVADGERPKEFQCKACKRWGKVPENGRVPVYCTRPCLCTSPGCRGRARSAHAVWHSARVGRGPLCPPCARESRVSATRKANAATIEQRRETMRKVQAALTTEQRSEIARKSNGSMTPEQRAAKGSKMSAIARRRMASMTPEERSKALRRANAAKTPEQRAAAVRKAWETRRAKAKAK